MPIRRVGQTKELKKFTAQEIVTECWRHYDKEKTLEEFIQGLSTSLILWERGYCEHGEKIEECRICKK